MGRDEVLRIIAREKLSALAFLDVGDPQTPVLIQGSQAFFDLAGCRTVQDIQAHAKTNLILYRPTNSALMASGPLFHSGFLSWKKPGTAQVIKARSILYRFDDNGCAFAAILLEEIHQPTMIIIDDHIVTRMGLKAVISEHYNLVAECDTGFRGLKAAEELKPDIIILDINLPDINGINLITRLRKVSPDSAILMFTQSTESDHYMAATERGAKGYLFKSDPPEKILATMKAACAGNVVLLHDAYESHLIEELGAKLGLAVRPTLRIVT